MDFDELFGSGHNKFICCGQFMDFFLGRGRPVWWYITGSDFFGQATQEVRIGLDWLARTWSLLHRRKEAWDWFGERRVWHDAKHWVCAFVYLKTILGQTRIKNFQMVKIVKLDCFYTLNCIVQNEPTVNFVMLASVHRTKQLVAS